MPHFALLTDTVSKTTYSLNIENIVTSKTPFYIGRDHKKTPPHFLPLSKKDSSLSRKHIEFDLKRWRVKDASKYGSRLDGEEMNNGGWAVLDLPMEDAPISHTIKLGVKDSEVVVTCMPFRPLISLQKDSSFSMQIITDIITEISMRNGDAVPILNVHDANPPSEEQYCTHLLLEYSSSDSPSANQRTCMSLLLGMLCECHILSMDWFVQLQTNCQKTVFPWPEMDKYHISLNDLPSGIQWASEAANNNLSLEPNHERNNLFIGMHVVVLKGKDESDESVSMLEHIFEVGGAATTKKIALSAGDSVRTHMTREFFNEIENSTIIYLESDADTELITFYRDELGFQVFSQKDVALSVLSARADALEPKKFPEFVESSPPTEQEQTTKEDPVQSPVQKTPQSKKISLEPSSEDEATGDEGLVTPRKNRKRKRSPIKEKSSSSSRKRSKKTSPPTAPVDDKMEEEEEEKDTKDNKSTSLFEAAKKSGGASAVTIEYSDLTQDDDQEEENNSIKEDLYYDSLNHTPSKPDIEYNAKRFRKSTPATTDKYSSTPRDDEDNQEEEEEEDFEDLEPFVPNIAGDTSKNNNGAAADMMDEDSSEDDLLAASVALAEEKDKKKRKRKRR